MNDKPDVIVTTNKGFNGFTITKGTIKAHSLHPNSYPTSGEISIDEGRSGRGVYISDIGHILIDINCIDDLIDVLQEVKTLVESR